MTEATKVFEPAAGTFLDQLTRHNNREWFIEHRQEYEDLIAEPLGFLLATAEPYGPGRVMRPNRDVRFSKDKTPYRTTMGMWAGSLGVVYLQVGADGLQAGGGIYHPERDQLGRAREAIDRHPSAGAELERLVATLERQGFEFAGPSLTTAPRGYPRDHPRIDLLRLQHYAALAPLPLTASLAQIQVCWAAVEPLIDWVQTYVAG